MSSIAAVVSGAGPPSRPLDRSADSILPAFSPAPRNGSSRCAVSCATSWLRLAAWRDPDAAIEPPKTEPPAPSAPAAMMAVATISALHQLAEPGLDRPIAECDKQARAVPVQLRANVDPLDAAPLQLLLDRAEQPHPA